MYSLPVAQEMNFQAASLCLLDRVIASPGTTVSRTSWSGQPCHLEPEVVFDLRGGLLQGGTG
jgi:hypothetical protein